jgi:hypothetical protein
MADAMIVFLMDSLLSGERTVEGHEGIPRHGDSTAGGAAALRAGDYFL